MPSRDQVFEVADALFAQGQRPSRRNVQERLARGGSPRVILRHLDAWREARAFKHQPELKDLPKGLRDLLDAFAMKTWKAAQFDAADGWQRERVDLEGIRRDEAEDREHLLGQLEQAQARIAGLEAQLAMAVAEDERLRATLVGVEDQLGRARSEAFWDRVMQEIHAILPLEGGMTPDDILATLQPWTKRGAAIAKEKLTPGSLREKMKVRSHWGRYLVALDDGRFVRRAN